MKKKTELTTGNQIGDEGAKAMSEILDVNTTLKTLGLSGEGERERKRKRMKNGLQEMGLELKVPK